MHMLKAFLWFFWALCCIVSVSTFIEEHRYSKTAESERERKQGLGPGASIRVEAHIRRWPAVDLVCIHGGP